MSVLYFLIPLALILLGLAVWAFVWAARHGQFDDLETQGWSVILDDDQKPQGKPESNQPAGGGTQPAGPENKKQD